LTFSLGSYQPYHAACADVLARCGNVDAARAAYKRALALTSNVSERQFLMRKLEGL
jgi:predicted RNA polymerase sigma factor